MYLFNNKRKQHCETLQLKFDKLKQELRLATEFVEVITEEDLDTISLSDTDFTEAVKLSKALQTMQKQLQTFSKVEKQRNWSIEGQARFGELLRMYNQEISELSDYILKFLIDYLNANQGGIFILNEENPQDVFLELKACYAYDRKKFTKKKIQVQEDYAEGLIGQTFLEGKITHLKNVPQDYVRITSGLGDANPSNLVIVPLQNNDQKLGIIEIASFSHFEEYQIDFLEKISESIATSISIVRSNEITRNLLRESQYQADTLRAQEEELRQNNEELLTTQEEMIRRGNELSSQIDTINRSGIIFVEFDKKGVMQEANQAFYDLFQYQEQEIIQQNQHILKNQEERLEDDKLWAQLAEGVAQTGEYSFLTKDQDKKWLKGGYTPIIDANQEMHKIILIAFDITESKKQMEEIHKQGERMKLQEIVLLKNNQKLTQAKEDLQDKIDELNQFKADEDKRIEEKNQKSQVWVNKMKDKLKSQSKEMEELKALLIEKENHIKELENKLIKLN